VCVCNEENVHSRCNSLIFLCLCVRVGEKECVRAHVCGVRVRDSETES